MTAGSCDPTIRRRALPSRAACLALVLCLNRASLASADEVDAPPIAEFDLPDAQGRRHRLSDLKSAPVVVLAFLGVECPLARLYAPRLERLAREFAARNVVFLGIDSNQQDSPSELLHFAREHEISFPLLKDAGNQLADALGAERTPQVFVLDADRRVQYAGRIDDQYGVGYQRPEAARRELAEAVESLLRGAPIATPRAEAPGCRIGRVRAPDEHAKITWSAQIARLVQTHCQECHRPGELAPFSLLSYEDAANWQEMIREVVADRRMPPWHASPEHGRFRNDPRLTDDEAAQIVEWVDHGAPRGEAESEPPPRQFTPGWNIGVPDRVIHMSDEPFDVPAEGAVAYQWFRVDSGFTEDVWVHAAEARPGAPGAVHHVTVYHEPPGVVGDLRLNDRINLLVGYNPGGGPWRLPEGLAMRIPAGSQIVFEMHYTPNGAPQRDRSYIGLTFIKPKEVRQEVLCIMPANTSFTIPPGDANYPVMAQYQFPADVDLLLLRPHMHLRGKSFRYEALSPEGSREILLDVPRYDFNWQHSYVLSEPRRLSKGTQLVCTAAFDNSTENLANPDPAASVRWGDQSWEEMMIGIVMVVPVDRQAASAVDWLQNSAPPRPHRLVLLASSAAVAFAVVLLYTWRTRRQTALSGGYTTNS